MCRPRIRRQFCTEFDPRNSPRELIDGREEGRELPLAGRGGSGPGSVHRSGEHLGEQCDDAMDWTVRSPGYFYVFRRRTYPSAVFRRCISSEKETIRRPKALTAAAHKPLVNMSAATKTENVITLKGSVAVVSEFFYCAINSILYQRGE